MSPASPIPRLAWTLGVAGLLPFFAHALFAWLTPASEAAGLLKSQVHYAAAILTFVGALHWSLALAAPEGSDARAGPRLVWGVIPSIYAWISTLYPLGAALPALMLGLLAALAVDAVLYRGSAMPRWFMALRVVLTTGALLCLAASWLAMVVRQIR